MTEFPKDQEALLYKAELTKATDNLAEAILRANIFLPQVYSAIRVFGAQAILVASSSNKKFIFSSDDLAHKFILDNEKYTAKGVTMMMESHKRANVDNIRAFIGREQLEIQQRVSGTLYGHLMESLKAMENVTKFGQRLWPQMSEENRYERVAILIDKMCEALMDDSLRQSIKDYRQRVAENRDNKFTEIEKIRKLWGNIFLNKLTGTVVQPKNNDDLKELVTLFTEITEPSESKDVVNEDGTDS